MYIKNFSIIDAVNAVLNSLEDIRALVDGPNGDQEFLNEVLQNEQLQRLLTVSMTLTLVVIVLLHQHQIYQTSLWADLCRFNDLVKSFYISSQRN